MAEINVVPYIDVMLVLLVIFMITAPLLSEGINVDLPQAKAKVLNEQLEPLVVSVDYQGRYYLNIASDPAQNLPLSSIADLVANSLQSAKAHNQKRAVVIKGDRETRYEQIVKVMAVLQQAGAENIGLMTKEPDNQAKQ